MLYQVLEFISYWVLAVHLLVRYPENDGGLGSVDVAILAKNLGLIQKSKQLIKGYMHCFCQVRGCFGLSENL